MVIRNVHERFFRVPPARLAPLVDSLAGSQDALWPHDRWPPMQFDRPLQFGAVGGHGPVRYIVEDVVRGRHVRFGFFAPRGFDGYHCFDLSATTEGCCLRHTIEMQLRGFAWITWPFFFRPLHDALLEDCLDRAARAVGELSQPTRWSWYVRCLRGLREIGRRRQSQTGASSPARPVSPT